MIDEKATQSGSGEKGATSMPDPEVSLKPERRQFSAEYKLRILAEADRCKGSGEIGALLRREGLYRSHLEKWRQQQRESSLRALAPQKRGRKPDPQQLEVVRLKREVEQLQKRLQQAELVIEFQKKLSSLFGLTTSENNEQL